MKPGLESHCIASWLLFKFYFPLCLYNLILSDLNMNMFIVSVLLAAVYLTGCSSHRPTSRGRTSFVTRAQIGRICNEIVTLREEIGNQQKEIGQIVTLKEEISQLQQQNTELQNRIEDLEQSSTGAG